MENIIKRSHPKMTGQNDREDKSLTGQVHDQAGHCPLTGCYFEPWEGRIKRPKFAKILQHMFQWKSKKSNNDILTGILSGLKFNMTGKISLSTNICTCNKWHENLYVFH